MNYEVFKIAVDALEERGAVSGELTFYLNSGGIMTGRWLWLDDRWKRGIQVNISAMSNGNRVVVIPLASIEAISGATS